MSDKLIEYQDHLGNTLYFHSKADIIQYTNSAFTNVSTVKGALDYINTNFTTKTGRGVEKGVGNNSVVSVHSTLSKTATEGGVALGAGLIAGNYNNVTGTFNGSLQGSTPETQAGDSFVVGNGTGINNRSNAFRVEKSGMVYSGLAYNTGGADFAEMYEWKDGNPADEERRGRFVALDGDKIVFADSIEDVIGITSALPCIVGNNCEDWHKRYVTDVFGAVVYEKVTITTEAGELIEAYQKKVNPDYNPSQNYIPRSERKEWAYVGQLGQIVVCDDGTCEVGGKCTVTKGGYATRSDEGYRVIKRNDGGHVTVLFYLK